MLNFKTFLIATAITFLMLAGFVNSSEAAQITSLSASVPDDWGSGANISAHLGTDEGVDYINWYVDSLYRQTSMHNSGTTSVNVDLGSFTGDIQGAKYEITAIAFFWDEDAEESVPDDESYKVRVFKPMYTSAVDGNNGVPQHPDVNGTVMLYSHYFDGQNIVMSGSVYACNGSNDNVHCSSWFRHTEYDADRFPTGWQRTTNGPSGPIEPGMSYSAYPNSMIDYPVGGSIGPDDAYYLNAHIHLKTGQDDRHVDTGINTFTKADNP